MHTSGHASPVVLFISPNLDAYGIGSAIRAAGYELYGCETAAQACRLLLEHPTDLVIINSGLPDAAGVCQQLRLTSTANMYPILMAGPDNHTGVACVAAFEAGADDFVAVPVSPAALQVRLRHHLEGMRRLHAIASISAQASSAELAMILQFLEAERKTGRMVVKRHSVKGSMVLREGALIRAEARGFNDVEAVAEMLCWTSSTATFIEEQVQAGAAEQGIPISQVLVKAMAQVATYRAAKHRLPSAETILVPGKCILDAMATHVQRVIYEHAIGGNTVEEILREETISPRVTVVTLLELIDADCLAISTPLFTDYSWQVYQAYPDRRLHRQVKTIKAALEAVAFPLREPVIEEDPDAEQDKRRHGPSRRHKLPVADAGWSTPAPQLVIVGNHVEHPATFLESLAIMHESMTRMQVPRRRDLSGVEASRFFFAPDQPLDIVCLPPVIDRAGLRWLDQHYREIIGAILFTADTTTEDTRQNLRLLRQLWGRFKGLYYLAVPKLPDSNQEAPFRIECRICGHCLSVNMDQAGVTIRCPACNEAMKIPDCMDYLAKTMHLPDDVGVVQIQVNDSLHARDLLLMLMSEILTSGDADRVPEAEWSNETWAL